MGAMAKIRVWQAVFLVAAIAGILIAASTDGAEAVGVVICLLSLLLFFVLVAVVGWVRQGQRTAVSRRRG